MLGPPWKQRDQSGDALNSAGGKGEGSKGKGIRQIGEISYKAKCRTLALSECWGEVVREGGAGVTGLDAWEDGDATQHTEQRGRRKGRPRATLWVILTHSVVPASVLMKGLRSNLKTF